MAGTDRTGWSWNVSSAGYGFPRTFLEVQGRGSWDSSSGTPTAPAAAPFPGALMPGDGTELNHQLWDYCCLWNMEGSQLCTANMA